MELKVARSVTVENRILFTINCRDSGAEKSQLALYGIDIKFHKMQKDRGVCKGRDHKLNTMQTREGSRDAGSASRSSHHALRRLNAYWSPLNLARPIMSNDASFEEALRWLKLVARDQ
jgi:hypothetical protein